MKMNVGIIGFGWMAFHHYEKLIKPVEGCEVVGVYDIDQARLDFAKELGLKCCTSAEELLAMSEIDTILVATPNQFHKDYSIAGLRAGKNVICEKPVTLTAAELEEIIAVQKQGKALFTVHHNRRRDADYLIAKKVINDGTIGTPLFIESRVQGANGIPGDWRCTPEGGGGMIYDWVVHLLDQLLQMIDSPVTEVYTQLHDVKYPVDDNVKVLIKYANGICAQIDVMTSCFQPLPRWHVMGTDGTMNINNWECEGSIVRGTVQETDWSLEAIKHAAGFTRTMQPRPKSTTETLELPKLESDFADYYRDLMAAVEGKAELAVKPEQALRTMKIIDLCFQSANEGRAITGISI